MLSTDGDLLGGVSRRSGAGTLYRRAPQVQGRSSGEPWLLWGVCPLLFIFWISRMVHGGRTRGEMQDDPLTWASCIYRTSRKVSAGHRSCSSCWRWWHERPAAGGLRLSLALRGLRRLWRHWANLWGGPGGGRRRALVAGLGRGP